MLAIILGSEAGEFLQAEGGRKMGPQMIGLYTGETQLNLCDYEGDTSSQAVKRKFFEILARQLSKWPAKDCR
jgi:hypothetical protein